MGISPKEIMRGNIVCYEGKSRIVKAVSELIMLEGDKNWIGGSLMNGEPISEVWLERLGFKKWNEGDPDYFYPDKLWMKLERTGDCYAWVHNYDTIKPNIQYVHQLQVLFFSVTGEHLQLPKLPKK